MLFCSLVNLAVSPIPALPDPYLSPTPSLIPSPKALPASLYHSAFVTPLFPSFYPISGLAVHSGRSQISLPGKGLGRPQMGSSLLAIGREITLLQLQITGQSQAEVQMWWSWELHTSKPTMAGRTEVLLGQWPQRQQYQGRLGGTGKVVGTEGKANSRADYTFISEWSCISFIHLWIYVLTLYFDKFITFICEIYSIFTFT